MIYLDNAATTAVDSNIISEIDTHLKKNFGNASSTHSLGQVSKHILELSRKKIASLLKANPSEIYFTSSATEATNMAIKGLFFSRYKAFPTKKTHIITSSLEHKATIETVGWLKEVFGVEVDFIKHDCHGKIDVEDVKKKIKDETLCISLMHVNNELGNINPVNEVAQIAKERGVHFLCDCVQSVGKVPLPLWADFMVMSGHKIYAPKGIGILYCNETTKIEPLIHGGSQERKMRAGTESYIYAFAFASALENAIKNGNENHQVIKEIESLFLSVLMDEGVEYSLIGDKEKVPHITNLYFPQVAKIKILSDMFLMALDGEGVCASSGSACTSGSESTSHVLQALGRSDGEAKSCIRFSFSKYTTKEEVQIAAQKISIVIKRFTTIASST